MANLYVHEPLPSSRSIRLISLAPSVKFNKPIQCDITILELRGPETKVPYEALSYIWGSPTGTIPIQCQDKELLVTPNCHVALRHLRMRFSRRTLWIDAICIDQGDDGRALRERNAQVQMMGEIYERASRVLVWLGPAHPSTPRVFRLLRVSGLIASYQESYGLAKRITDSLHDRLQGNGRMSKKYIGGLQLLLWNKWFIRVWTMQEAVFARRCVILCGDTQLDWDLFQEALAEVVDTSIGDNGVSLLVTGRTVTGAQIRRYGKATQAPEASFVSRTRMSLDLKPAFEGMDKYWMRTLGHLQCSIPHDKVYGLYSIFKATGLELPDVDYNKSVQEVYGDIAKSFIKFHGRSLDVLLISIRPQGFDEFPTWTPNWEMSHMPGREVIENTRNFTFENAEFRASSDSLATIPSFMSADELQVRGYIIGSVQSIFVSSTAGQQPEVVGKAAFSLNFVRACYQLLAELESIWKAEIYQGGEDPVQALIYTLAFHKLFKPGKEMDPKQRQELEAQFYCWADIFMYPNCEFVTPRDVEKVAQLDPSSADKTEIIEGALNLSKILAAGDAISDDARGTFAPASWFHSQACYELANWAFLSLETGYIGRAFYNCREGDKLALLAGSRVPYVLSEAGPDRYQVVAPAYVYGMMDGELWPPGEEAVKDFVLV
ncbi:HET-domain-containing protein [Rostrohypoxylon terebratum]|nr:HET-domain-containing protein [Rostrohypoxylon terebratum]